MLITLLQIFGFYPAHSFSLYFPLAVVVLHLLFLPFAYLKRIRIFYNSSLRAVFTEEVVFRGLIYGGVFYFWHSVLLALVVSSLVFGAAHMQNLWWAGWRQSFAITRYAAFTGGPLFGVIRWLSGDIYLGILVHFLHNLYVMFPPPGFGHRVARTPKDGELRGKS